MEIPILYDIAVAAKKVGLAEATLRAHIQKKIIEVVRIGRRVKIPHDELVRIIEEGRQPRKITNDL